VAKNRDKGNKVRNIVAGTVSVSKTLVGSFIKVRNEIDKRTQLAQWNNITKDGAIGTFRSFDNIK
jgi:hypothetical protein